MRSILSFTFSLFLFAEALACCGAGQTRVFPLGTVNDQPVCAVFELSRDCRRGEFVFHEWFGKVTLEKWDGNKFDMITVIDTVHFLECECEPDVLLDLSKYIDTISLYYTKALFKVSDMASFEPFRTTGIYADSVSISKMGFSFKKDSLFYMNKYQLSVSDESLMCLFLDEIREIRTYENSSGSWSILSVACENGNFLPEDIVNKNRINFNQLSTAVTYLAVDWHGITRDKIVKVLK